MTKRMLIDATHPEETRVVVLDGNRLEEFDVETSTKRTLKGNIYLAKVVRVEPSLQAAFVDYGGNRHGFLAFGEIHPDYYQIPVADRQRLLEQAAAEAEEDAAREQEEGDAAAERVTAGGDAGPEAEAEAEAEAEPEPPEAALWMPPDEPAPPEPSAVEPPAASAELPPLAEEPPPAEEPPQPRPPAAQPARIDSETVSADPDAIPAEDEDTVPSAKASAEAPDEDGPDRGEREIDTVVAEPVAPETIGGGHENGEEDRPRRIAPRFLRNYKIQEVIKRRQILLVQVVKEERGTKGAALTTYLSLAGRYSVLMPNTPRGGGISRKITSAADRKRLREVMQELAVPDGMGIIVRTAGANRPKAEIKRDCEYLLRLWDSIRETTLKSVAPALIYEEANLIKRAIRDVYSRDVDEIVVDGEEAYRAAKDFMRMLIPSHAKKVQIYKDGGIPLFARAGVESQLDAMHSKRVELRSGGYVVIDQTEALVSIDVNSGRATRERNIEETALKTNLEAADEIARQLRLRDLAGLIVIDFIDMENNRNNAAVERRLKEALKQDRARIQVGRISHFGLLEMSRQRLRPSLTETAFVTCPHCSGTGLVRSVESSAVHVLRAIEEEAAKRRSGEIVVRCAGAVAFYLLNHKRARLAELEAAFGLKVLFAADETLLPPALRIERTKPLTAPPPAPTAALPPPVVTAEAALEEAEDETDEAEETAEDDAEEARAAPGETEGEREARKRRRRRRRRGGRREDGAQAQGAPPSGTGEQPAIEPVGAEEGAPPEIAERPAPAGPEDEQDRRGRRGRRGGRHHRREEGEAPPPAEPPRPAPGLRFQGATPANPFGDAPFDLFDEIEPGEARATVPEQPAARTEPEPEPGPEPATAAESGPKPVAAAPAAPPPADERPPEGPHASIEIKPIVVDEVIAEAPKKRGWWRR
ncbi:Rne/Rng family ribonuclease [Elioraea sp.]|uniref:Rne/Rng family ribonuclease n=1 Tax=Elioraea sp. TaxID=2185103 RepID=UPI003F6FA7F8